MRRKERGVNRFYIFRYQSTSIFRSEVKGKWCIYSITILKKHDRESMGPTHIRHNRLIRIYPSLLDLHCSFIVSLGIKKIIHDYMIKPGGVIKTHQICSIIFIIKSQDSLGIDSRS